MIEIRVSSLLLEACEIYQPKTISAKELIENGKYPVYGANGQIGFYDKFNHEESEVTVTCRGATCGTVNIVPEKSWITGNAMVFKPRNSTLTKEYLAYFLRCLDWSQIITGTAQPQITRNSMKDILIDIPSISEQLEIVGKLDNHFSRIDSSVLLAKDVILRSTALKRALLQDLIINRGNK
jgi:type I restriction enzyme S subunit